MSGDGPDAAAQCGYSMKLPMQLLDEASDIGRALVVCQPDDRRVHVVSYERAHLVNSARQGNAEAYKPPH